MASIAGDPYLNQPNLGSDVSTTTRSMLDMSMRLWGSEWNMPDHNVYQFTNRGFDSTDRSDTGFYNGGAG